MTPLRVTIGLCLAFVAVVIAMFVYSVTREPVLSDDQLRERGVFILPTPREIAPFELTTTSGDPFTVDDLRGHWSFLYFGFTNCPDVCPTSMAALGQAAQRLATESPEAAADFQGVMITVDPERDDTQTLAQYLSAFSPSFIGVRGDRAATAGLATSLNVAFARVPSDDGGYQVDHTGNFVIIDPRGEYFGFAKLPHQADNIVATFRTLRERWH